MFLDPARFRPAAQTNALKPGWIEQDARLADVIDIFRAHIDLRLLAVVDRDRRPVGAIFEIDIRGLLFNPFGHALMTNPSFGGSLGGLVRPCPEAEVDCPLGDLLDIYAAAGGGEGLILTRHGCYDSLLDSRDLVRLAADREVDSARARSARAERIGAAGRAFTEDVAELSEELTAVASNVERFAHQLAGRAVATGEDASSVAIAAVQMVNALNDIAARGRGLACALDGITVETAQARQIRADARATVSSAGARVEALADTTTAIDGMLALINTVASRTKILAINASIEAARAGPAGRGFAVVASEVKNLAGQTAAAAHDIARNVDRIQTDLGEVVDGHGGIQRAIAAIASMSDSIDVSVGQQNDATHMISRHVDQSVEAGADISARAGQISDSASDLGREAAALETLSRTLAGSAARLHDRADAFVRCVADI